MDCYKLANRSKCVSCNKAYICVCWFLHSVLHLDVTKKVHNPEIVMQLNVMKEEYSTEMYIACTMKKLLKGMTILSVIQQQNHQIHKDATGLKDVNQLGLKQIGPR